MNLKLFTLFNWKCLSQGSKPGPLPSHYLSALIICRYFMESDVLSVNGSFGIYPCWDFYRLKNTNTEGRKSQQKDQLVNHVTTFSVPQIHR